MKIIVSNTYLEWKKENKNTRAASVIDKFLCRVFTANDITQVSPKPKSVGNNLRKTTGTVNEYTLSKKFRVYARYAKLNTGDTAFCLASVGVKGVTDQNNDIITSLIIFDNMDGLKWAEWQPSAEQLAEFAGKQADDDEPDDDEPTAPVETKQPTPKKKGKPLDENGMTVAERKALQKKQKQEEQRKRNAEKKKTKQAAEKEKAQQSAAQTATPAAPINEPVVTNNAPTPIAPVTPNNKPENAPVDDDIRDDEIRVIEPEPISISVEFNDYADAQYHLEIVERQMKIEQLKIRMIQHEIALEQLAIKRQLLLQMHKMKTKEK
ncbi:hypothetical protein HDR66_03450 [bacterium]|nr:hypothetical protein [bacterium]